MAGKGTPTNNQETWRVSLYFRTNSLNSFLSTAKKKTENEFNFGNSYVHEILAQGNVKN